MSDRYKPEEDPSRESDIPNISGLSPRRNVEIEEAAQRSVAENSTWLIAKKAGRDEDTKTQLEAKGFTVLGEHDDLFYKVTPPEGWTKSTEGYWTTVKDQNGEEVISQFFKGAWYDRDAFASFREKKD